MTLTEIEYGSLASSATLNNNFQFLQDKITELSALITSESSSYSSTVATLNNSITELLGYKDSFIPTGTIIISQSTEIPQGFLLCDGSEILIADYTNLYAIIGNTYGQTDSTSFCIPNLKDKTIWGKSENTTLGQNLEAGLPNITAYQGFYSGAIYGASSGAFYSVLKGGNAGSGAPQTADIYFDASRCSSIFGKSTTVQPPAIVTNFVIKY